MLATLHIRNVPDELHAQIHERARKENRSMSAEVISLLQHALGQTGRTTAEILNDIRRRRSSRITPTSISDSTQLLREDRER